MAKDRAKSSRLFCFYDELFRLGTECIETLALLKICVRESDEEMSRPKFGEDLEGGSRGKMACRELISDNTALRCNWLRIKRQPSKGQLNNHIGWVEA